VHGKVETQIHKPNKPMQRTWHALSICVHVRKLTLSHTNRPRIQRRWLGR